MILSPDDPTGLVIALCWVVFVVVWAVSALFVKRTVERSMGWVRLIGLAGVVFVYYLVALRFPGLRQPLWPRSTSIGVLADLLAVAGLAVAIWARVVLGRNWSAAITFKLGHQLIQHGPYAYVRHPIYSGMLLMMLGTAVAADRLSSFVILALVFIGLAVKSHFEEQLMTRHFPEAYPQYKRRVKALIPGMW